MSKTWKIKTKGKGEHDFDFNVPPPSRGIKKYRYSHSVWGRRRKQATTYKHPPPTT